jgi:carboxypeptidase C (cathepsin A)
MDEKKPDETAKKDDKNALIEETPVVTHHEITIRGKKIAYSVTTGRMPLKNDQGEIEANIFFMAYTKEDARSATERKLMFSFNGGPGSSSVWLHLGALGPKLAPLNPDGSMPAPPYCVKDNPETWLDLTDLVFIDPVGTGFSRAKDEETSKKFWTVDGDIESLGTFIRLYITKYQRWTSPLYLVGESYGTTRGAGLTGYLVNQGIALSGLLLISTVLHFQTLRFAPGNDLPYVLYLPAYAATAYYHKRLAKILLNKPLEKLLREVEVFANGEYAAALHKGDRLLPKERLRVLATLAKYTGLSELYLSQCDLRIEHWRFCKELLRPLGKTIGRLDSRLLTSQSNDAAEHPEFDPSHAAIMPPFTTAFNGYVREQLGYESDLLYNILGMRQVTWDWGKGNSYVDTSIALKSALTKNTHLKVFVASGYFDLATPYSAAEYTFTHMGLPQSRRDAFSISYYESGHMMYIEESCLVKLKADVAAFLGR